MTRNDLIFKRLGADAAANRRSPTVDFHMHTTWTDGADSIAAMHQEACQQGLSAILFSEHARHTSADWFFKFAAEVRGLPVSPCRAMVGAEVKILDFDGSLDIAPMIAETCDLVMASVHRFPGETADIKQGASGCTIEQAVDIEFRLSMAALDNPDVDILGHPFGMTIRRFGGTPPWPLVERLIAKAATAGKAFEINARYHDNPAMLLGACLAAGAPVSFGSNAHSLGEVGALLRHPDWQVAS